MTDASYFEPLYTAAEIDLSMTHSRELAQAVAVATDG